jgi:hypothetical protein
MASVSAKIDFSCRSAGGRTLPRGTESKCNIHPVVYPGDQADPGKIDPQTQLARGENVLASLPVDLTIGFVSPAVCWP